MPRFAVLKDSPQFQQPKSLRRACQSPVSSEDEFDFEPRKRTKLNKEDRKGTKQENKTITKRVKTNRKKKNVNKYETDQIPPKYVWYLLNCLKESVQSKLSFEYGFGLGSIVPLPLEWTSEQIDSFTTWIKTLGFTLRPNANTTVYRISNTEAISIVKCFSSQLSSNISANDTNVLLAQMHAPPEDDNLAIIKALPDESLSPQREIQRNGSQRSNIHIKRKTPPETLMWGSPIQADNPRPPFETSMVKPGRQSRQSICSIPEEPSLELDEHQSSPDLNRSVDSLDLDDIEPSEPALLIAKRLSFGGFLASKSKSKRLSIDSIAEGDEPSSDFLNLSRENAFVQSKKTRNHHRRLSRYDAVKSERRMSIFVPKTARVSVETDVKKKETQISTAILSLVLTSNFIPITHQLKLVSKSWRKIANEILAWKRADYHSQPIHESIVPLYESLPWGQYLSDGAYKKVFKVYSKERNEYEAISVMDIRSIELNGNQTIVRQEIAHSLLFSHLVDNKTCPNFLRIHSFFLMPCAPLEKIWGSATLPLPQGTTYSNEAVPVDELDIPSDNGLFQYIRMELCDGGNVEDFLRQETCSNWSSIFFQMVFALYAGRDHHQLRHYDVKLLNFFLKSTDQTLYYEIAGNKYSMKSSYIVKLADYGTADTELSSLGHPITIGHFTTLENTPMDFFLQGDAAKQSYAVDTFPLGLSLLHLLTGSAPYEEILDDVVCPPSLQKSLVALWKKKRPPSSKESFTILGMLLQDKSNIPIICNTIYRYCVLFGIDQLEGMSSSVATMLVQQLTLGSKRHASPAQMQYELDSALYALTSGSQEPLVVARTRLSEIPGALELLKNLIHFDPTKRPTLYSVLMSPIFNSLRVDEPCAESIKVMTYSRKHLDQLLDI